MWDKIPYDAMSPLESTTYQISNFYKQYIPLVGSHDTYGLQMVSNSAWSPSPHEHSAVD